MTAPAFNRPAPLLLVCATLATLVAGGCRGGTAQARPLSKSELERRWGIQIENVRRSAGGFMIDVRFRVTDPEKAKPLFDLEVEPYLQHDRTGVMLQVPRSPKTGQLRSHGTDTPGRLQYIFFTNPGRLVAAGDSVAIILGSFRADRLRVE